MNGHMEEMMNSWVKTITLFCCMFFILNSLQVHAMMVAPPVESNQDETVIVSDSLVVTVSYGFQQEARYGRLASMQVDVYNKGESFEGRVNVVMVNENQDNIAYSTEGLFAGGSKTEFNLLLPMNRMSKEMHFSIQNEEKKTIVEELIPLNVKNLGEYSYVGILSEMPTQLSYFEYFGNKVVNLDENSLPNDYLAYDMLDMIVVDQFNLDSLEVSQLEALMDWTRHGGTLVLGIGINYMQNVELLEQYGAIHTAKINYEASEGNVKRFSLLEGNEFTKQLTKIKDYETARSQMLKDIESSKSLGNYIEDNIYVGSSMLGNLSLNDLSEIPASKSVSLFNVENSKMSISKHDSCLYDAVKFGDGVVQLFHFRLGNSEISKDSLSLNGNAGGELLTSFYSSIVMISLEQRSPASILKMQKEAYSNSEDYRITNIGSHPNIDNVPQVAGYIIILSIYLVLIGPILFIILWKLKRQMRIWVYVPLLTLAFLFIMYAMGSATRIKESYAGFMNIEYYDDSLHQIEGKTYASIVLTNKYDNNIVLNSADSMIADASEYPGYYGLLYQTTDSNQRFYDYAKASTKIIYKQGGIALEFHDRPAFSGELFEANYHKPYEDIVIGEVLMSEDSITGELQNQSQYDLKQSLLWVNGYYVNLGDIKAGSSALINEGVGMYASNIEGLMYTDNSISKARGFIPNQSVTPHQSREVEALSYIFSKYLKDSQSAYLIAFTDQVSSTSPISQLALRKASFGVSAIVAKVDLKTKEPMKSMVTNFDVYLDSSSENAWDQETRYAYTNTIEFEYNIPRKERIQKLFLSELFNDLGNKMEPSNISCGRIYLYNYEVEQYDLVFDLESEYGNRSIDQNDLTPYLSLDNHLRVKYESRSTAQDIFTVPILSCYKEDINATD